MPEAGARRHDHPHHAARGAVHHRRQGAVRDAAERVSTRRSSPRRRPNSSPPSSRNAKRASGGRARRAIWSSPTSRRARGACATSTRCSGSPNTSIAFATPTSSSPPGCSRRANSRCFAAARNSSGRVRCRLHFLAGRAEERLSFDVQRPIARQLGYSTRAGLIDVERFMKHYFLIAKDVGDLTAIVCAALEERQTKRTPAFGRLIGRLRRRTRAIADAEDFKVDNDRVNVIRDDAFERDPVNLIRLFWIADRSNLPIHPNATRLVTQSLKRIDARLREDPEANRLFLDILTSRNAPEIALRRMNEAGVLGRFIPDFGRVVGMMQFSMYHHYTVDEHLIRAVGELSAIEAGRLAEDLPLATKIMPQIAHRTELYLAAFLHDIAKGRGVDHSLAGAEVARKLGPRLGLSPANTERVAWLIEQHLRHVQHGAGARPARSAHGGGAVGDRADARAPQDAAGADRRRHSSGGPGRMERLEGPASAHALLGDRSRARRRPFGDRPQGAGRSGAGDVAPLASGLVRSGIRRLRPASLPGLLAEGGAGAAGRPRQIAARDGRRNPLAGDRGHDRRFSRRDRGHRGRARPPAAPDRHRRRLRRRRRQHRRRADFHHHRRPGARHHFRLARLRARRGRIAPRPAHRRQHREDPARRGPAGRNRRRPGSRATCGAAPSRSSPK